jgi:hypothetical protein
MNNKLLAGGIILLFILLNIIPIVISDDINHNKVTYVYDGNDQEQYFFDHIAAILDEDNDAVGVQSFKPSKNILTRIWLRVFNKGPAYGHAKIGIKENLDRYEEDLTGAIVYSSDIRPYELRWVNFDLPDLYVIPDKTYYIFWYPYESWDIDNKMILGGSTLDKYDRGEFWYYDKYIGFDQLSASFKDLSFVTFGDYDPYMGTNLSCSGELKWRDIKPNIDISGSIYVKNIGVINSPLDWEIAEYPSFGSWAFNPQDGEDLLPSDGEIIINVTLTVPKNRNQYFSGEIIIRNKHDSSDFEVMPVSLTTTRNKPYVNLFYWILDYLSI